MIGTNEEGKWSPLPPLAIAGLKDVKRLSCVVRIQRGAIRQRQKFLEAVYVLIGTSTIDKRLIFAAMRLLELQEDQLPEEMRDEFEALRVALTKIPLSTERSDYQPRPISEDDGRKLAEQIFEMVVKLMGGL
jgi:hypothetical protein